MKWLKDKLIDTTERDRREAELRLVFGHDWQSAQEVVAKTGWAHCPDEVHSVAVQLGKAGVPHSGLSAALNAVIQIANDADHYTVGAYSEDGLMAAAEFVGTVSACGARMELAPNLYRSAMRVTYP